MQLLLGGLLLIPQVAARPAQTTSSTSQPDSSRVMNQVLVIDRTGRAGRSPIHTDAVEAQIVAGAWQPPKDGDTIAAADGSVHTWKAAAADENGSLNHESLRGGYGYWQVDSAKDEIMLLHAAGHDCVYVNGEIRVGDPYRTGIVILPVQLQKGENHLLFQCSRGGLSASLQPAPKQPFFNLSDITLPDLVVHPPEALIVNPVDDLLASVVIVNPTNSVVPSLSIDHRVGEVIIMTSEVGTIPPLGIRKAKFRIRPEVPTTAGPTSLSLSLRDRRTDTRLPLETQSIPINCVEPHQLQRRTYMSSVDDSVQYWALLPANPREGDPPPHSIIFALHGADVEATNQAAAYKPKSWAHIVAPTNRRKYGFDWEDWGRIDAMEVHHLAMFMLLLNRQDARAYLTGHSMGGHGTWSIGALYPDRFLAIGPSAGWISFWSYSRAARFSEDKPIERMFRRASSPSDTLALSRNYLHNGVYILHGDQDDNVPVDQARQMRKHLGEFHPDFAYFEQPGAGHWWGDACVDWPPMLEFFEQHRQVKNADQVEFVTPNPGVSAACRWVRIESQIHPLQLSSINIQMNRDQQSYTGTTSNVRRLSLNSERLNRSKPVRIELDVQTLENVAIPANGWPLCLERQGEMWSVIGKLPIELRHSMRNGPFKDVFRHRMIFVYGTRGTTEENAWALNKARYDAETFWYRGNGSIDVISDTSFDPAALEHRNIILYGNADTNSAWAALLSNSPLQVKCDTITIGGRNVQGDGLAALFLRPRTGDDQCCIGVVSGTGLPGMRLTDRLPYFVSGVAYPDLTVLDSSVLMKGVEGVRAAGFFGDDWSVEAGEVDWNIEP